jgi:hypothetical protein
MKRDALPLLVARGIASALSAWKALLLVLLVNVALAFVLARPVTAALHDLLDLLPSAQGLLTKPDALLFENVTRTHPRLLGDVDTLDDLAAGKDVSSTFLGMDGASGTLVTLGLLNALLAGLFAGGFAGRFGADRDRGSLAAFGADAGRFAFSSLFLSVLSIAGILASYTYLFAATGAWYEAEERRYEWEATGLLLARLLLFLLAAGLVRLVVLFSRASMGLSRNGNPFLALASGAGFVAGRPIKALLREVVFGGGRVLPLVLWGALAPVWNGRDPGGRALFFAAQQAVVFLTIVFSVGELGAASSWMRRTAEANRPAPEKLERTPAAPAVP